MPLIRVNCPENSLTAEQKAKLAPLLVDALMRQEVDPVTEAGKRAPCVSSTRSRHTTASLAEKALTSAQRRFGSWSYLRTLASSTRRDAMPPR
jgi:hypothetical protein